MRSFSLRRHADELFRQTAQAITILISLAVGFIGLFVLRESLPFLKQMDIGDVFFDSAWFPLEKRFGMAGMLVATVLVSLGATLIAAPLGLASAVFMTFFARRGGIFFMKTLLALMAGTPSVVFGLWGLSVLVPLLGETYPPGASVLTAIIVLSLMLLPTVALTSYTALKSLPNALHQASHALGLSRVRHVCSVAIPGARTGILSGLILSLARALGETMAVLMVAGNVPALPTSLFDPARVLTANIALEMGYATGTHRASLFASGLLIVSLVLGISLMAGKTGKGSQL